MGFNCGIVGLPNVGKSTLFNALTATAAAEAANFPFCTIEPNTGRVAVPDERLDKIAAIGQSAKIVPTQLEFVDIAGLVLEVKDLLLKQIESGGNELIVEIDDEIGTMRCDRLRVKQCLINLMSNAAKFTRDGRIRLQVHRAANGRDWVIFQVEDTGIGMTPDQQRRVFGAFEQGDESISVQFGGIGLGLNISQKLAHAMGGDIQLESKPGAGSVFWLTLPRFCMVEDGRREEMRIDADGLLARGIKGGAQRE